MEWLGIAQGDSVLGIDLSRLFGQPITSGLWWGGCICWGGSSCPQRPARWLVSTGEQGICTGPWEKGNACGNQPQRASVPAFLLFMVKCLWNHPEG